MNYLRNLLPSLGSDDGNWHVLSTFYSICQRFDWLLWIHKSRRFSHFCLVKLSILQSLLVNTLSKVIKYEKLLIRQQAGDRRGDRTENPRRGGYHVSFREQYDGRREVSVIFSQDQRDRGTEGRIKSTKRTSSRPRKELHMSSVREGWLDPTSGGDSIGFKTIQPFI